MAEAPPKVIETRYGGRFYRSRTEARWAVFFDELKIEYHYEAEGWEFPTGRYLPDFFLPSLDAYFEVKGRKVNDRELAVAKSLCLATGKKVYIFPGTIAIVQGLRHGIPTGIQVCKEHDVPDAAREEEDFSWCECPDCGRLGITFQGRSDRLDCKKCIDCSSSLNEETHCAGKCRRIGSHFDTAVTRDSNRLIKAYSAAMSARFEFGSSGAA
jgi:hypothetical protein